MLAPLRAAETDLTTLSSTSSTIEPSPPPGVSSTKESHFVLDTSAPSAECSFSSTPNKASESSALTPPASSFSHNTAHTSTLGSATETAFSVQELIDAKLRQQAEELSRLAAMLAPLRDETAEPVKYEFETEIVPPLVDLGVDPSEDQNTAEDYEAEVVEDGMLEDCIIEEASLAGESIPGEPSLWCIAFSSALTPTPLVFLIRAHTKLDVCEYILQNSHLFSDLLVQDEDMEAQLFAGTLDAGTLLERLEKSKQIRVSISAPPVFDAVRSTPPRRSSVTSSGSYEPPRSEIVSLSDARIRDSLDETF